MGIKVEFRHQRNRRGFSGWQAGSRAVIPGPGCAALGPAASVSEDLQMFLSSAFEKDWLPTAGMCFACV